MTVVKLKKTQGLNETETLVHLDNSHSRPLKVYGDIGGGSGDFDLKGLLERTITEAVIPEDVTSIEINAFNGCASLTSVEMPNVTEIGSSAFNGCASLTSVEMPNVTEIGSSAFYGCASLPSVEMPNVTEIGEFVFQDCTLLSQVVINNINPPVLGSDAFDNCHNDLKIYVPASAVDTYKAASGWSTYADKIEAIEE